MCFVNTDTLTQREYELLLQPPFLLTIPIDKLIDPAARTNGGKKIPRPQNSWLLFRRNYECYFRQHADRTYSVSEISKMATEWWRILPDTVKDYFRALSKLAKQCHKDKYPDYSYHPKRRQNRKEKWVFKDAGNGQSTGCRTSRKNKAQDKSEYDQIVDLQYSGLPHSSYEVSYFDHIIQPQNLAAVHSACSSSPTLLSSFNNKISVTDVVGYDWNNFNYYPMLNGQEVFVQEQNIILEK